MKQQLNGNILKLQDVTFHYPDGSLGLDHCCISIQRGSRTVLLGANGSGKTTLLLHCNGILRPGSGRISFDGFPLEYSRKALRDLRSRVGFVFQNPDSQLFSASVWEDVSFGPMNLGLSPQTVRGRVEEALQAVELAEYADKPVHNLSYGQKKRVCIAGVLAMAPEVLILDEPMAGLDVTMQAELTTILERLHSAGMTIVAATHDMDFAYQWADSFSVVVKGRCVVTWDAAELPGVLRQLASLGVGVPRAAELYQILAARGVLDSSEPSPRSLETLVRRLRSS